MGNLADSCTAAKHAAQEMGVPCMVLTTFLEGESSEAGLFLTSLAREIKYNERPIEAPCFVVCAGETTCSVDKARGVGGPSQELTLGASIGPAWTGRRGNRFDRYGGHGRADHLCRRHCGRYNIRRRGTVPARMYTRRFDTTIPEMCFERCTGQYFHRKYRNEPVRFQRTVCRLSSCRL